MDVVAGEQEQGLFSTALQRKNMRLFPIWLAFTTQGATPLLFPLIVRSLKIVMEVSQQVARN